MTAPIPKSLLEIEVHILRDILTQLIDKGVKKGDALVFVDDETNPNEGDYDWDQILKSLAKKKIFTHKGYEEIYRMMSESPNSDFIKEYHAKVNASVKSVGDALIKREKLLKWVDGTGIMRRGRLLFDPTTGEAKLGNHIKIFKQKQLKFIRTLVERRSVTCLEMYHLVYGTPIADLEVKNQNILKREIDGNILKPIKQELGITKSKIQNPDIFESAGKYYTMIG